MSAEKFTFPTLKDGRPAVELKFCELVNSYRNGEKLEPEAIDWMDSANNWLSATETTL